jgi:Domain of unknown function (DUF4214)
MRRFIGFTTAVLLGLGMTFIPSNNAQAQVVAQDDGALIATWYQRYLGRTPDPSEVAGWLPQLRRGQDVEASILGSDEYFRRKGNSPEGFVTGLYVDLLSRQPSGQEVQGWLDRLGQNGFNREVLAADFLRAAQSELAARTPVPPVYIPAPPVYNVPRWWRDHRPEPMHIVPRWWRRH